LQHTVASERQEYTLRSDAIPLPRPFAHYVRSWHCGER